MSHQRFGRTLTSEGAHDGMSQKLPGIHAVRLMPTKLASHADVPIHN